MHLRMLALAIALGLPPAAIAQEDEPSAAGERLPEEVVVTGDPSTFQLLEEMLQAEKRAYEMFNQFNDEKRFHISCSEHAPTGTRIETQICQPAFEREALRAQGQAYLWSYRMFLEPYASGGGAPPNDTVPNLIPPASAVIARHRPEYQRKLRQVAEEHPEFLEAIIQYTERRERYEAATRPVRKPD